MSTLLRSSASAPESGSEPDKRDAGLETDSLGVMLVIPKGITNAS